MMPSSCCAGAHGLHSWPAASLIALHVLLRRMELPSKCIRGKLVLWCCLAVLSRTTASSSSKLVSRIHPTRCVAGGQQGSAQLAASIAFGLARLDNETSATRSYRSPEPCCFLRKGGPHTSHSTSRSTSRSTSHGSPPP